MSQYRKKPVVIEARQWLGGEYAWLTDFCGQNWTRADARDMHFDDPEQVIVYNSAERQWLHVPVGHWIVRGVQGELYPCEPDIFKTTYEHIPPPCVDCNGTGCRLIKVENFIAQTEECGACRGTGFASPATPPALPERKGK